MELSDFVFDFLGVVDPGVGQLGFQLDEFAGGGVNAFLKIFVVEQRLGCLHVFIGVLFLMNTVILEQLFVFRLKSEVRLFTALYSPCPCLFNTGQKVLFSL